MVAITKRIGKKKIVSPFEQVWKNNMLWSIYRLNEGGA